MILQSELRGYLLDSFLIAFYLFSLMDNRGEFANARRKDGVEKCFGTIIMSNLYMNLFDEYGVPIKCAHENILCKT